MSSDRANSSHTLAEHPTEGRDFIRTIIDADLQAGRHGEVVTRFPPEPNGYMHIGHAKSVCLNFGLAQEYQPARCHLRFDDTNPSTEDMEYVEALKSGVRWLGFDWGEHLYFASDYYERLYQFAEELIGKGKAYVCDLNEAQMREYRGTITEAGKASPYRERSVDENLDLFRRMRAGEYPDGAKTLRAKIDMSSPNMKLRDPPIYRIRHVDHYRTGNDWCIYPLYDFTHCLSDALEGVTHSLCTLEFENNRDLYDWVLDHVEIDCRPHQYEFARLNLNYQVMSKRKFLALVNEKKVSGWDDPRMPTIAGMKRAGFTAEALRAFCDRVGVAKNNSIVDYALLEHTLRDDLNGRAPRLLCVLRPLKVVLENYPEGKVEQIDAPYFPADVGREGTRKLPLARELYIERDDFSENPPKKWHRLAPGGEVRLRHGYVIKCEEVVKDAAGNIVELRCSYDPDKNTSRKIKGTIHWVSAEHSLACEVRVYDRLFQDEEPGKDKEHFFESLNPDSLEVLSGCRIEPSVADEAARAEYARAFGVRELDPLPRYQFERQGFFVEDSEDSKQERLVFNRTVALRDSWGKSRAKDEPAKPKENQNQSRPKQPKTPKAPRELSDAEKAFKAKHPKLNDNEVRTLVSNAQLRDLFEATKQLRDSELLAGWVTSEVQRVLKEGELKFGPTELASLLQLIDDETISARGAKDVFAKLAAGAGSPSALVDALGVRQIADPSELEPIVARVLGDNQDAVQRYKDGNKNLKGAFVGQIMKATGGKASPKVVNQLLAKLLDT